MKTTAHAFATIEGLPVAADEVSGTEFMCVCGVRGTYAEVAGHIIDEVTLQGMAPEIVPEPRPHDAPEPNLLSRGFPSGLARDDNATRAAIERYAAVAGRGVPTDDSSDFGGDTKAHYLPIEPRVPALPALPDVVEPLCRLRGCLAPLNSEGSCVVHPITNFTEPGEPQPPPHPRAIAELFQDMLRQAFQAGVAAAASGEAFEAWYAREVLA